MQPTEVKTRLPSFDRAGCCYSDIGDVFVASLGNVFDGCVHRFAAVHALQDGVESHAQVVSRGAVASSVVDDNCDASRRACCVESDGR